MTMSFELTIAFSRVSIINLKRFEGFTLVAGGVCASRAGIPGAGYGGLGISCRSSNRQGDKNDKSGH